MESHDKNCLGSEKVIDEYKKEFAPPAIGMEFETYDDAYNYFICYAKEVGFRVRVKNSWFKRNTKEKYGAVLCCSSQGFKRIKDVNRLRKETRTGCPAMIRLRLVDSKRWRVLEVSLDHNHHLLGSKLILKSAKKTTTDKVNIMKRKFQADSDPEVRKIRLYRALVIDSRGVGGRENNTPHDEQHPNQLLLRKGDSQAIYNYLCRMQLTNPNFFYLMDFSEEGGCLKNVFWIDGRSRADCCYFGDVLFLDNTCMVNKYEVPLIVFVGVNHHGQSVLLGCGLVSGETMESYTWLLKAWLKSNSVCSPPHTIITDWSKILQNVISEIFPGSQHCFSVSDIMRRVPEKLGGLQQYEPIRKALNAAVYETLKVTEFEAAWSHIMQQVGVGGDCDDEWLKTLYDERVRWAPVYVKGTFLAGMSSRTRPGPFFDKYVHKQTPLKEFLDKYELALQRKHKEESCSDIESRTVPPNLKTRCPFEEQLSKVYTREIFQRFQFEVEEMYSCFSTTQLHMDGPVIIFLVKERVVVNNNKIRDFEVVFNRGASEVRCICNCFNFNGYLCRHALSVLNYNGVEEIPLKYVLSRWKKDYKRLHAAPMDYNVSSSSNSGGSEKVVWLNQLYRSGLQVVEEGAVSVDHYNVTLEVLEESLNRVHDVSQRGVVMIGGGSSSE